MVCSECQPRLIIMWWCNDFELRTFPYKEQMLLSQPVPRMESQLHLIHLARPHQLAVLPSVYLDVIMQKRKPPLPCTGEYAIIELMAHWVRLICVSIADTTGK